VSGDVVGIILAAGQGRRMRPLGADSPKTLLPVANQPLISHQLELLHGLGVRDVFVVVGHGAAEVVSTLGDGQGLGLRIQYVDQGQPLGTAHALGRVREHVRRPFLLLLGDYWFSAWDAGRLPRRLRDGDSAIAAKREADPRLLSEACAITVDPHGKVLDIVEKPAVPSSDLKGCGFYALRPEVFDAVARTPRTALRDEYELTVSLELYVGAGHTLYAEEVLDRDVNLTRPEDLLACNLQWLDRAGRNQLVARTAHVGHGVRLDHAVIGERAHVEPGSRLKEVVVFPGARVEGGVIESALVTPREVIPCVDTERFQRGEEARS
jgi:NDP-sugar pyrophosphorylase family protein